MLTPHYGVAREADSGTCGQVRRRHVGRRQMLQTDPSSTMRATCIGSAVRPTATAAESSPSALRMIGSISWFERGPMRLTASPIVVVPRIALDLPSARRYARNPPSTTRVCPVTYDAPSEHSHTMASAISPGSASRPIGMRSPRSSGILP